MNINCVICSDLFTPSADAHVTPCGHIFHFVCLTQWLERSRSCPQCRNKCSSKSIHKIYFNIANLDTSSIDIGSLQEKLDNAELQIRSKQAEITKAQSQISDLKDIQKKTMKTITVLEKKLEQADFLQHSLKEQISILKVENASLGDLRNQADSLKQQMDLMTSVQNVLTATHVDADKILKDNADNKVLAVMVAALKRELILCENKKNDVRNTLRSTQKELKQQQELRKSLEEKVLHLESENYRMSVKINVAEKNTKDSSVYLSSSEDTIESPEPKKMALSRLEAPDAISPGTSKRVKRIEESDSPYLTIKSSSIGLTPLLKMHKGTTGEGRSGFPLRKTVSDLCDKYSILKRPRLTEKTTTYKPSNLVSNGFGGSEKIPNFPEYPETKKSEQNKPKSTLNSRLKSGKLKKLPNPSSENMSIDKFLTAE